MGKSLVCSSQGVPLFPFHSQKTATSVQQRRRVPVDQSRRTASWGLQAEETRGIQRAGGRLPLLFHVCLQKELNRAACGVGGYRHVELIEHALSATTRDRSTRRRLLRLDPATTHPFGSRSQYDTEITSWPQ